MMLPPFQQGKLIRQDLLTVSVKTKVSAFNFLS